MYYVICIQVASARYSIRLHRPCMYDILYYASPWSIIGGYVKSVIFGIEVLTTNQIHGWCGGHESYIYTYYLTEEAGGSARDRFPY